MQKIFNSIVLKRLTTTKSYLIIEAKANSQANICIVVSTAATTN